MVYRHRYLPLPNPLAYSPVYTDPESNRYLEPGETMSYGAFLEWGPIAPEKAEEIPDAVRTNWACDLLAQEHTDPFFIALGMYSPHFPNYAPQKFFDMYDPETIEVPYLYEDDLDDLPDHIRNRMTNRLQIQDNLEMLDVVEEAVIGYLACVSFADAMLGRVLDALEASAYNDNTIILFWSDQGYHHGEKGQWGKHTLWQETSHVPFIFAGNGLPENKTVETTVSLVDIYPTLIELCNLPEQHQMDGTSLAPVLNDPSSAVDRDVFMAYMQRGGYAIINSEWRYIQYHDGSEELYDLKSDPNEWYNLATDQNYTDIKNEMKQSAPAEFHAAGTPRNTLDLVIQNDSFYWEPKDKSVPAKFINCSITFSNPIKQQGISFVENIYRDSMAFTEQVIKEQKDCRYIPAGKSCYFDADDQFITSSDNALTLSITYLDDSESNFELQYNAAGVANKSIVISKTNTDEWITNTVMVADAAFDNQFDYQADFRVTGEVYIRSVSIDKYRPSDVSVDFDDHIIERGMEFLVGTDPSRETYTEKATIGGEECRYIPRDDKRKYGYFTVLDDIITATDNNLIFEITYYDSGTNTLSLQYNSTSEDYHKTDITLTDTKTWKTRTFNVTNAALDNQQNNQSDFRVMGEAYIKRVAVSIGSELPEIPEVPIVYITPQEPAEPAGARQIKQQDQPVSVDYEHGTLRVSVPEEMIDADLQIYNYLGQSVYQTTIDQTEELVRLPGDSKLYILSVQNAGKYITRVFVAF